MYIFVIVQVYLTNKTFVKQVEYHIPSIRIGEANKELNIYISRIWMIKPTRLVEPQILVEAGPGSFGMGEVFSMLLCKRFPKMTCT